MDAHARYQSPLTSRYASPEMAANFSDDKRFSTWRKLWLNLAVAEKELGLDIPEGAIEEMKNHIVRAPIPVSCSLALYYTFTLYQIQLDQLNSPVLSRIRPLHVI